MRREFMASSRARIRTPLRLRPRAHKHESTSVLGVALLLGLAGALLPACASLSTHLTPRPTAVGQTEVHANVDASAYTEDRGQQQTAPAIDMEVRRGVAASADVGLKVYALGGEVNARLLMMSTPVFDVALVPGVGFSAGDVVIGHEQAAILTGGLTALAGFNLGKHTLTLGPKLIGHLALASATETTAGVKTTHGGEAAWLPGGEVGCLFRFSEHFGLFPELNVVFPYLPDEHKFARPYWQGGLGFHFVIER